MKLHEIAEHDVPLIYFLLRDALKQGKTIFMTTWGTQENKITDVKLRSVDDGYGDGFKPALEIFMQSRERDASSDEHSTSFFIPKMTDQLEMKKVGGVLRVIYPDFEPSNPYAVE